MVPVSVIPQNGCTSPYIIALLVKSIRLAKRDVNMICMRNGSSKRFSSINPLALNTRALLFSKIVHENHDQTLDYEIGHP